MCAERRASNVQTVFSNILFFSLLQMNAVYQHQCIWEEQASRAASGMETPYGDPLYSPYIRLVETLLLRWDFS